MNIGWIGTGIMGGAMAAHLQAVGHRLFVFNRTRDKAAHLLAGGATWGADPAAVAARAEIVFTMVGFPADVEQVYFGPRGLLAGDAAFHICVDMTTAPPALAQRIAAAAAGQGRRALDAPVSGGDVGARNATLAIMAGGDRAAFEEVLPLFSLLGKNIVHLGGPGAGQHAKLANQLVIAGAMIGVCEALLYARRQGLEPLALIEILEKGAAQSWSLSNLGRRIAQGNLGPGFYVEHFIKDLGIALAEATRAGLVLPGLQLAHQLYQRLADLGHGRAGTQSLILALDDLSTGRAPCAGGTQR